MSKTQKQRYLLAAAITLGMMAAGVLLGYAAGFALALQAAEGRLVAQSKLVRSIIEAYAVEAHATLDAINTSPYGYCSEQEIAYIRTLVYRAQYINEAGRIRNNQIDCTAVMGRLHPPLAVPPPLYTQKDGTAVHTHLAPPGHPAHKGIALQLQDSYVVSSEFLLSNLGTAPLHFTTTVPDTRAGHSGRLRGEEAPIERQLLLHNGTLWNRGALYVTLCSPRYLSCISSYASLAEIYRLESHAIHMSQLLGGSFGLLCGALLALLYDRGHKIPFQLRRAIRREELWLVYQPIVHIENRRILGAEALLRWKDEDGFPVNPEALVLIAEQRGYIRDLTTMILRRALREFGPILRTYPDFHLHINITAHDLADAAFLSVLEELRKNERLEAKSLTLEITEDATANTMQAMRTLQALKLAGYSIQIDDFGTGYSSLSYLQNLPIDGIKIDRSFTRAIGTAAVTVNLLPHILELATTLGMQVVAEGIESEEQAEYFKGKLQAIHGQGWLYGRSFDVDEYLAILDNQAQDGPAPCAPWASAL